MSAPTLVIRPLRADEAATLAGFGARLFLETYAPTHARATLEAHVAQAFAPARIAAEVLAPGATTLVVEDDGGEWMAYAQLRRAPLPPELVREVPATPAAEGAALEIARFYVDARWHRRGVGHALMDAVLAAARADGMALVWLQAWEGNTRALDFYARRGFRRIGTRPFDLAGEVEHDPVLVLSP